MHEVDADVVVIGGGPSGLTVAAELAAPGRRVVVLEKRGTEAVTRAGTLLPRPMELFDARGIADRFIRKAREVAPYPFSPVHIWGGTRPVDWSPLDSRYGFTMSLPQHLTEGLLRDWALERGAELMHGCTARHVTQDESGVRVEALGPGGDSMIVRAQYAIGADGSRSDTRRALGIPYEGHGPTFTGMIADIVLQTPLPTGRGGWDNKFGWVSCFPIGEGATRFVVIHHAQMQMPQDAPVVLDELQACVNEICERELPFTEMRWSSRYSDAMRIVDNFRSGRVFLVGESSRVHYPASGVGMNFCIQDAFNLGWKLRAVLNGHADPELLDTYDSERRPVALELLTSVESQVALQFNFTPEGMALKRRFAKHLLPIPEVTKRLVLELNGLDVAYPSPPGGHPLAGCRVPDMDLITLDPVSWVRCV